MSQNAFVVGLLSSQGDYTSPKFIFSDYVCRINSNRERNIKVLLITDNCTYILNPIKDGKYEIKLSIWHAHVRNVVLARDNITTFRLASTTEADQLMESFRRNRLILYLKDRYKKKTFKDLEIHVSDKFAVTNRYNNTRGIDAKYDKKFRAELQPVFGYCEKVGIVRRYGEQKFGLSHGLNFNILLLIPLGLLILTVDNLKFKEFVPLVGTRIRPTVRSKLQYTGAIDIFSEVKGDNFETLVFGSKLDAQDWITKIDLVQSRDRQGPRNN